MLNEHDPDRPVGYVRELCRLRWPDGAGSRLWHAALLALDEDGWPGGQGVSISYTPLSETSLTDGARIVERALVDEISITSRSAISGARLLPAERTNPARRAHTSAGAAPREHLDELERSRRAKLAERGVLVRRCGTVLEVR